MKRVAVFGLALAGEAAARALIARGLDVVLSDDVIVDEHRRLAYELGCTIIPITTDADMNTFLDGVDVLIPSPGVAPHHRVIVEALMRNVSVRTEIDIAYEWEQQRSGGPRPILGVTGTDGKTTTTMITAALLRGGGRSVGEVGNTDLPFMAAIDQPFDAFVVECSSFRLQFTDAFRCDASVWLNLAPDHLDWHGSIQKYAEAKRRLWAYSRSSDVVIAPTNNEMILETARATSSRSVTFGLETGDYRVSSGSLISPHGKICSVEQLWRALPHDITNSLAAAALVIESGLSAVGDVAEPLHSFESAHHRIELVGEFDGSTWYDDSKATSPHAALTAIRSFAIRTSTSLRWLRNRNEWQESSRSETTLMQYAVLLMACALCVMRRQWMKQLLLHTVWPEMGKQFCCLLGVQVMTGTRITTNVVTTSKTRCESTLNKKNRVHNGRR